MKFFGLYYTDNIPNVEFNHKKYCDKHGIKYTKKILTNTSYVEAEKLTYILDCLQDNIGDTLVFVDSYTYFVNFDIPILLDSDVFVQIEKDQIHDNFLVIKSTQEIINLFFEAQKRVHNDFHYEKCPFFNLIELKKYAKPYPTLEHNKFYYSLIASNHSNVFVLKNILCLTTKEYILSRGVMDWGWIYDAELLCDKKIVIQDRVISSETFETFNPGKEKALVTLYTKEIIDYAYLAEKNFKEYCLANNITLHIYREIPAELKAKGMTGAWCKPYVLLNHINNHKAIGWIDADIMIGKNYNMDFSKEISVYQDPSWYLNSGFMLFKSNDLNKQLIEMVKNDIEQLASTTTLSATHIHGGDQSRFIKYFKELYPELSPLSILKGNTHHVYPCPIHPSEMKNYIIHFMGWQKHYRIALMQAFEALNN